MLPVTMIYWYILACIYVTVYSWLDSTLRRKYPQINARWEERQAKSARRRAESEQRKAAGKKQEK
jgi:hypothetical protein